MSLKINRKLIKLKFNIKTLYVINEKIVDICTEIIARLLKVLLERKDYFYTGAFIFRDSKIPSNRTSRHVKFADRNTAWNPCTICQRTCSRSRKQT